MALCERCAWLSTDKLRPATCSPRWSRSRLIHCHRESTRMDSHRSQRSYPSKICSQFRLSLSVVLVFQYEKRTMLSPADPRKFCDSILAILVEVQEFFEGSRIILLLFQNVFLHRSIWYTQVQNKKIPARKS